MAMGMRKGKGTVLGLGLVMASCTLHVADAVGGCQFYV